MLAAGGTGHEVASVAEDPSSATRNLATPVAVRPTGASVGTSAAGTPLAEGRTGTDGAASITPATGIIATPARAASPAKGADAAVEGAGAERVAVAASVGPADAVAEVDPTRGHAPDPVSAGAFADRAVPVPLDAAAPAV